MNASERWTLWLARNPVLHGAGMAALGVASATGPWAVITPTRVALGLLLGTVYFTWFRSVLMPAAVRNIERRVGSD